ncbi:MAG: AraC family transcriptional regulator [Clostridia bacterium]|nr:AraC family transcriptional regulator [Clostridia bacterium]
MAIIEEYKGALFSTSHSIDKEPRDEDFKPHIHDYLELLCLVKGKVSYMVEGKIYKLSKGALLLMRGSETHKLIVEQSSEYERYVLNFRPEVLPSTLSGLLSPYFDRELGERNLYLPSQLRVSPVEQFKRMYEEMAMLEPCEALVANLCSILSSIKVVFLSGEDLSRENRYENEIISYINKHITEPLSLSQLSAELHLSTSQLSRSFKALTGTSIHSYILTKRLILFQEKLSQGKSALDASLECGFKDYSSFYRLYKKRFGVSPTKR